MSVAALFDTCTKALDDMSTAPKSSVGYALPPVIGGVGYSFSISATTFSLLSRSAAFSAVTTSLRSVCFAPSSLPPFPCGVPPSSSLVTSFTYSSSNFGRPKYLLAPHANACMKKSPSRGSPSSTFE